MKNKLALYLVALGSLTLAACQTTSSVISSSSSNSNSSNSIISSSSDSSTSITENTYALSIEADEGVNVKFDEDKEGLKYLGGEEISFDVELTVSNKNVLKVLFNDKELTKVDGKYSFVMPSKDSVLKIETLTLGDENLLEEKPVTVDMIPTDVNGVISLLKKEQEIEGKYFSSGTYSFETTESYDSVFNYEINSYHNNVLRVTGNKKMAANNPITTSFVEERGLTENNRYYVYNYDSGSFSSNEPSAEYKESLKLYNVVKDDASYNEINDKKESEVKKQIEAYDFAGILLSKYFDSESYGSGFASSSGWKNVNVSSVASEDKMSFTTTLSASYDNYSNMEYHTLSMTFDGTYFLTSATYVGKEYSYDDFNNETNQPNENANPINSSKLFIESNKGYKQYYFEKLDVNNYAMHDYNVDLFYKQEDFEVLKAVDNKVEVGSILSYNFTSFDNNKYLIKPIAIGSKEEGFVEQTNQGLKVIKEGNFTLLFDNGAGEIKEVNVTSIIPSAKKIDVTLQSNAIFVGDKTILKANILPTSAPQDYEISVSSDSTGSIEYNKLADGSYELTALTAGNVIINVNSALDKEINSEVTLTINEKPNIDTVKAMLFANTMKYSNGSEELYINFNEDGTGSYRFGEEDYWSGGFTYEDEVTFKYVIDEESLSINITLDSSVSYGNATLVSVGIVNNSSISAVLRFYDTNDEPVTLTSTTRIDLSSLVSGGY